MPILEKQCSTCSRPLPLDAFCRRPSGDGFRNQCKECQRAQTDRRNAERDLTNIEGKTCQGPCGRFLALTEFHVAKDAKDGRCRICKDCRREMRRKNKRIRCYEWVLEKTCIVCQKVIPIDEFDPIADNVDGHANKCRDCRAAYRREHHAKNRETLNQKSRDYYLGHKEQASSYGKKWRSEHPEQARAASQAWAKKNPEKRRVSANENRKKWNAIVRVEMLLAFGGFCECCGETDLRLLTFDHRLGNGADHRREIGGSQKANSAILFRWARKHMDEAQQMLRILCWNCNTGAWKSGTNTCPHQEFSIVRMALDQCEVARVAA